MTDREIDLIVGSLLRDGIIRYFPSLLNDVGERNSIKICRFKEPE